MRRSEFALSAGSGDPRRAHDKGDPRRAIREPRAERAIIPQSAFRIPPYSFGIPTIRISVPCSELRTSTASFSTPSSDTLL